jgi:hypothetical protein
MLTSRKNFSFSAFSDEAGDWSSKTIMCGSSNSRDDTSAQSVNHINKTGMESKRLSFDERFSQVYLSAPKIGRVFINSQQLTASALQIVTSGIND